MPVLEEIEVDEVYIKSMRSCRLSKQTKYISIYYNILHNCMIRQFGTPLR
jgi:hypothetical protein